MSTEAEERAVYWEARAKDHADGEKYYRAELAKAHALIGRIIHQASERWDTVRLTEYFPTDNLYNKRTVNNPSGEDKS